MHKIFSNLKGFLFAKLSFISCCPSHVEGDGWSIFNEWGCGNNYGNVLGDGFSDGACCYIYGDSDGDGEGDGDGFGEFDSEAFVFQEGNDD
jgi:hypothetical protein